MQLQDRLEMNRRMRDRASELAEMREDMERDFRAMLEEIRREFVQKQMPNTDAAENALNSIFNQWYHKWAKNKRDPDFDPRFAILLDPTVASISIEPLNMSASLFMASYGAPVIRCLFQPQ